MKRYILNRILLLFVGILSLASCKKFLDTKSDQRLSTPDTLDDLQALLDNAYIYRYGVTYPQTGSDEYFVPYTNWLSRLDIEKQGYIWDANLDDNDDWIRQYSLVLIANTVLDRIDDIALPAAGNRAGDIKGQALFLRSYCFYQLAQVYAKQYDSATAGNDLGIVLRLEADFTMASRRATVQQTYEQVLSDIDQAILLLPSTSDYRTRPGKAAAYASLARTWLQIGDYQKAKQAADQCLAIYSHLIDFNDPAEVNAPSNSIPIINRGIANKEIIYYQNDEGSLTTSPSAAKIDTNLYRSYSGDDIRKTAFFRLNAGENTYRFKGSYSGNAGWFTGLGTAEVVLVKAECEARLNNIPGAMQSLNQLLVKRYKTGFAPVYNPATVQQALELVLNERKKEMVYRGVRWSDIKRLNKNPLTAITLQRNLNGTMYTMPPNDNRYALLIPTTVMQLTNLVQNPR